MIDLFNLDIFKKCIVVAGREGLNRHINFVNISDTNDIASLLNKNDLLLTTGYGFKDNPENLIDFIIHLNNVGVCGLIIKENRFIHKIPTSVINKANSINFPILLLTGENTLGELSWHITGYLSNYKSNQLSHAINLQKEFNDMMLKDYSIDQLIHKLSEIIDVPVILLNHSLDIVTPIDILNYNYKIAVSHIIDLIKNDREKYSKCINESILDSNKLYNMTFSTFIVPTIYTTPNILIVLNSTSLIYPLSSSSIEQIIYSLSFCIIKKQMEFETKLKLKSSFFFDILYGNINNFSEFAKKGAKFGLRTNCKYICISGSFDFNNPYVISQNQTIPNTSLYKLKVIESIETESKNYNLDVIAFTQNNYFVTIFQIDRYNCNTHKEIETLLLKIQNDYLKDTTISFGVSSYFTSIDQLKTAYLDSLEALNNGYDMEKYNFIQYYRLRESRDILQMIPRKTLSEFSNNILGKLITCDSSEKSILVKTLKAYIDNKYDLSKTSRALYVHRNTIKYRLSRCEEILGISLSDSEDSFTLQLALEINDMISSN